MKKQDNSKTLDSSSKEDWKSYKPVDAWKERYIQLIC